MKKSDCPDCGGSGYIPMEGLEGYDKRCDTCNASIPQPRYSNDLQRRVAEGLARLEKLDRLEQS